MMMHWENMYKKKGPKKSERIVTQFGGFLKWGVPLVIIHFRFGFSLINKPFGGTTMTMETSIFWAACGSNVHYN